MKKLMPIAMICTSLVLGACGSTKKVKVSDSSVSSVVTPSVPAPPAPTGSSPTSTGQAPYNYSINQLGNTSYTTNAITTDNVLKVKLRVGTTQGNSMHYASELKVNITVNGNLQTPLYTTSNYTYGQIGETSQLIDFSSSISPGVPVSITVSSPMNDFYCTYWGGWDPTTGQPVNMLYNNYPGCRKAVNSQHTWSAQLIVQTSYTTGI